MADEDFDESKLKKLEDEYSAVTSEINYYTRKNLEDIKNEAIRLRSSLKKCQENEKVLVLKCQYLNEEIEENKMRVNQALKLGEEDQETIITLTKELENAWNLYDKSFEKEKLAIEVIKALKLEIENLSKLVENLVHELKFN